MALTDKLANIGNAIRGMTGKTSKLTLDEMPTAIERIGAGLIDRNITHMTIPRGVSEIGWYAFCYCEKLENVVIPESVSKISRSSFSNCTSLKNIVIPSSVKTIGTTAFYDCLKLNRITCLAETPPTLTNANAFSGLPSDYVIEVLPNSVSVYKSASNWSKLASHIKAKED